MGHRGVIAFKAKWDDIDPSDSSQAFSGHMWVMWSNSVLAQRACELLSGEHIVPGLPTI